MSASLSTLFPSVASVQAKILLKLLDPHNPIEMTAEEFLAGSERQLREIASLSITPFAVVRRGRRSRPVSGRDGR